MRGENRLAPAVAEIFRHPTLACAERHLIRSGSVVLQLQFASRSLADLLLPAFVTAVEAPPDLTVAIAGADLVDLSALIPMPRDRPRSFLDGMQYAAWQPAPHGVLSILDYPSKHAVAWLEDGGVQSWVASRPLLPLIHALTVRTPWTAVHGGSVGRDGRSLLLAGKGKSGKTTAALACARAGWDYAGDDYVFVNTTTSAVAPLYATARMRTTVAELFSDLLPASAELSSDNGELRHELRLARHLGVGRIKGGRLAAILLPRRRGAPACEFTPARRADAFAALLPVTTLGLSGCPDVVAAKIAALIDLAPVHFVDTGNCPASIPEAFSSFLDRT